MARAQNKKRKESAKLIKMQSIDLISNASLRMTLQCKALQHP
jgi:hypothetical protein